MKTPLWATAVAMVTATPALAEVVRLPNELQRPDRRRVLADDNVLRMPMAI